MRSLEQIAASATAFRDARDWSQFHTIKNLIASVSIEANELMEIFQWMESVDVEKSISDPFFRKKLEDECADVLIYLILLADKAKIDLLAAAEEKIQSNEKRYPVDKARGSSKKYDQL